jgi:hypothetical protein
VSFLNDATPRWRRGLRSLAAVGCLLVGGCIGGGEGWITGSIWLASCVNGDALDKKGDFDLGVNFFTGESVEDETQSSVLRRNALTLRLQNASLNIEDSDGLLLQLWDLAGIAQAVVRGDPVGITSKGVCSDPCPTVEDQLRTTLYLNNTCPDGRQPLLAASHEMAAGPEGCLKPTGKELPTCPTLQAADRQALADLCLGRFDDRARGDAVEAVLGGGACIYFCQLGQAKPGGELADPRSFRIDYGDHVSALLAFNVIDGRAVTMSTCAAATGKIRGMFSFDIVRGRSAQAFP